MLSKIPLPFKVLVETDMKNTKQHCVMIQGPSVILPDASYYKPEMEQQKQMILGIWTNVVTMVLAKTDLTPEEQAKYLEDTLKFDELLGSLVKTSEEWSEYVKMYNPMKVSKVATLVKPLNFKAILKDIFGFSNGNGMTVDIVNNQVQIIDYYHWSCVSEFDIISMLFLFFYILT